MAHFAKISEQNEVLQVLTVDDKDCIENGVETEAKGQKHLEETHKWPAHLWIKCSYNTSHGKYLDNDRNETADQSKAFRKNYPGIGWIWDAENNLFKDKKPFASWSLNLETGLHEAPVAKPEKTDTNLSADYQWNEEKQNWEIIRGGD